MRTYDWRFDYEGGSTNDEGHFISEEPRIYITSEDGDILEVYEGVIPLVPYPDCDDDDWSLSDDSLTEALVAFLNRREKRKQKRGYATV